MDNKKRFKKVVIAATAFSTAINLNACAYGPPTGFDPRNNVNDSVYGPASIVEKDTEEETSDIPEESIGLEIKENDNDNYRQQTEFDPKNNLNAGVYGPPSSFTGEDTET